MEFFGFLFLSIFGNHSEDNGRRGGVVGGGGFFMLYFPRS